MEVSQRARRKYLEIDSIPIHALDAKLRVGKRAGSVSDTDQLIISDPVPGRAILILAEFRPVATGSPGGRIKSNMRMNVNNFSYFNI
jgi:hypothetical protein